MAQNTFKKHKSTPTKSRSFRLKLDFLNDRKLHVAFGLFLLLASVFLLVSFISYLSTGKADQSVVEAFLRTSVKESGLEVENWFGTIGAITSYYFIFKWFGLAAILIPPLLFLVGHRILFRRKIISLGRALGFTVFYLLWLSIFTGYFLINSDVVSNWGFLSGASGYELAIIFDGLMGWGSILMLIFILVVFNMFFFNLTHIPMLEEVFAGFNMKMDQIFSKKDPTVREVKEEIIEEEDENDETGKHDPSLDFILKQIKEEVEQEENIEEEPEIEKPVTQKPLSFDIELPEDLDDDEEDDLNESWTITQKPEPKKSPFKDEPEFSIELPDDKEEEEEVENSFKVNVAEDHEVHTDQMENYDPTLDLPKYKYPTPDLLIDYPQKDVQVSKDELEQNKDKIVETLINFKIGISSIKATIGPTVTLYEIVPEAGVKIS